MGYLPRGTAAFDDWFTNFVTYIAANQALIGLTVDEVAAPTTAHTNWQAALLVHQNAQIAALAAADDKDAAQAAAEDIIRPLVSVIQGKASVTDGMREAMQITVRDTTPTPLSPDRVMEVTPPVLELICKAPRTVTVNWHPSEVGTDSVALPDGIAGVAIYVAVKATDGTLGPFQWIGIDSNSPYYHNVGNAETVTNVYRAQWYDKAKRHGPFGDAVEVAVTA